MPGLILDGKIAYSSPSSRMSLAHFVSIRIKSSYLIHAARQFKADICVLALKSFFIENASPTCFGVLILPFDVTNIKS